jgi:hypothetical protein
MRAVTRAAGGFDRRASTCRFAGPHGGNGRCRVERGPDETLILPAPSGLSIRLSDY